MRKRRRRQVPTRYPTQYRNRYDDHYYPRQRRSSSPIQKFFVSILWVLSIIVIFCLLLLIAFNFTIFIEILVIVLFIGAGLAILAILYLAVRLITAISHRISAASVATSKARMERERAHIEKERVQQVRVQVLSQEAKLQRENYTFYQKQEPGYDERPRQTRVIRDDHPAAQVNKNTLQQSPYRTRKLISEEALERILPAPSPERVDPEPTAVEETELEALGMPTKGQIFHYRRYKRYLKPEQLIIGIRKDGSPRIGSWQDFKITLVLGSSSSGKSTTVLEKCVSHVHNAGLLVVCDPGGFKPDSITQRMGALQQALMPGTSVALEHEDIMHNLERFRVELERRRRGADMITPLLLVIDELNGLLMDKEIKKDLTELIEKFGQQARGYNMFMVLCAQRASGLATIRNSVISFVCHKCPEMEASKILPARYAKLAPELGTGQTFVSDANGFIEPLQQIFISPEDITAGVGGTQFPTHPQTEPIAPRTYGAPARRQAATPPQQKLVLRRTSLVQNTHSAAGAIWGEETQANPPPPPGRPAQPKTSPTTEELVPDESPFPANAPGTQNRQDTFEMLALRRKKKK